MSYGEGQMVSYIATYRHLYIMSVIVAVHLEWAIVLKRLADR